LSPWCPQSPAVDSDSDSDSDSDMGTGQRATAKGKGGVKRDAQVLGERV
jgi:hypothetical protein